MTATIAIGVATGAIYGLVAVGLVLVYKASRVLNFAQAEFGTLALYLVWQMTNQWGWSWALAGPLAIAAMAVLGGAFERVVVRPMGDASRISVSVATTGLLFLLFAIELKVWGTSPRLLGPPLRGTGLTVGGFVLTPMHLLAIGLLGVLAAALGVVVARTRLGLGLLAVAEDAQTARLMGVPYNRISSLTWAAAGALGATAGLLIGPLLGAFGPLSLSTGFIVRGITAALLGGLTSLPGAFVGGIAIGVLDAALKAEVPVRGIETFGMLGVVLLVLLFRPRGLFGRAA